MADRRMDESPVPGGAFRLADGRVVNSEGKDITEEHKSTLDKIDKEEVKKHESERKRVEEETANRAMGGVGAVLARALGVRDPAMANVPVTQPRAASQDENTIPAGAVSVATVTGDPGPTPVAVRGIGEHRPEPTDSPADALPDIEEVLASNEERNEERNQTLTATAPRKKGGRKVGAGSQAVGAEANVGGGGEGVSSTGVDINS